MMGVTEAGLLSLRVHVRSPKNNKLLSDETVFCRLPPLAGASGLLGLVAGALPVVHCDGSFLFLFYFFCRQLPP